MVTFVNKHLNKINLEVYDLDTQFSDGVYLCLLTGLLEGYFVPLFDFHLTPQVRMDFARKGLVPGCAVVEIMKCPSIMKRGTLLTKTHFPSIPLPVGN